MKPFGMLTIQKSVTEQEILEGCRRGRGQSQRLLYERYSAKMLGVCIRYVKDKAEAEHVMIGGMVKVFEKIDQFNELGSFEGWVRRIMVNECLMYIRKNKNMSIMQEISEQSEHHITADGLSMLDTQDIIKLVHALPVGYRTVFNLYAIEGYNHAEIAEMLGITENTSKSQLSRARKYLQQRIASEEDMIDKKTSSYESI